MGKLFGTDGIRGIAGAELSDLLALRVGRALGEKLGEEAQTPTVLIARDTRRSGEMLEAALTAGLTAAGTKVLLAGVLPTPAVAYLVRLWGLSAGVMISASHNPAAYNGIKIFGGEGYKLPDEVELDLEKRIARKSFATVTGEEIGVCEKVHDLARAEYIQHILSAGEDLSGLRLLVDCACGSASATAAKILPKLGAECTIIHDDPNGSNINDGCGSLYVQRLADAVKEGGYDAALAFDGDADRLLMLDETGALVDGDRILAILGADMQQRGELSHNTIVATVMSNLGLHRFVKEKQLCLLCTKVGDRYVLEEMLRGGYDLGGEQSGHVILREYATTGDGQLTAVRLLSVLARSGKKLSELAGRMRQYPQVLVNLEVPTDCKMACMQAVEVQNLLQLWEERLAGDGRILLRPSGTEPLLRVMVEGADDGMIRQCAEEIAEAARRVRDQIRDKGI